MAANKEVASAEPVDGSATKAALKAVAYYRTSSATNAPKDGARPEDIKDSRERQAAAVRAYADKSGIEIVAEFYDVDVRGETSVMARAEFARMIAEWPDTGASMVLVENAGRFARDLVIQITGHDLLKARGISLVPVDAPGYFLEDTPTAKMIRNVLGAVFQFQKEELVQKLYHARMGKKAATGWCGGPKPVPTAHRAAARDLVGRMSLRQVASELARRGMVSATGRAYGPASVKRMAA